MRKSVLSLSLVTAIGLGSLIGCSSPEPKVITKTVTVTTTAPPEVVTKTVNKTPKSCLTAIHEARDAFKVVEEFIGVVAEYPPLVSRAADAGMNLDVDEMHSITAKMQSINSRMDTATSKLKPQAFVNAASACEASE